MHGCVVVEVSGGAMKMCLEVIFEVKKKQLILTCTFTLYRGSKLPILIHLSSKVSQGLD